MTIMPADPASHIGMAFEARTSWKAGLVVAALLLFLFPLSTAGQKRRGASFDPAPDWRPTLLPAGAKYAGNAACAECHKEVESQAATPMGRALERAADSPVLRKHTQLRFREGPYTYSIEREGNSIVYVVTDGKDSIRLPVEYAFGMGKVAQTYVLLHKGRYFESRVSFYSGIGGLDFTLGAPRKAPSSLEAAIGRPLNSDEINDCYNCHATGALQLGRIDSEKLIPGITCEGCHGPGGQHIQAMKAPQAPNASRVEKYILNPGQFDTEGMTQFCGACHRSWIQVQMIGIRGIETVRFQPYRIFKSKCYDHQDERISCTACHNPHEELVTDAAHYDAKCTACHQAGGKLRVCPTAKSNCASCHMPKLDLPGAHHTFTDHRIRIVRKGETYPE